MRFFNGDARLSGFALESFMQREKPLYVPDGEQKSALRFKESNRSDERSLLLTVGTDYEIPGYVARKGINFDPIDISKKKHYKWADYFDIVQREKDGSLVLEKGRFYILATYEHVLIPPLFAAEIASINDRLGEFRSHYAGFIDNGFGYGKEGELKGAPIVLEVRPFETMRITNKQPVARLKFEPTIARPIKIYGEDGVGSNYADQIGPRLAKQFRM